VLGELLLTDWAELLESLLLTSSRESAQERLQSNNNIL
jgi:hypothetical protein